MDLAAVGADVAVIDELLRDIAQRPVDLSEPDWMAKLRQAAPPVEEAGVAVEAAAALEALLEAYETGGSSTREEIRGILRDYRSFRWAAHLPRERSAERVGVGGGVPSPTCSRFRGGSGLRSARRADDDLVAVQPSPRTGYRGRTRAPGRCGPVIRRGSLRVRVDADADHARAGGTRPRLNGRGEAGCRRHQSLAVAPHEHPRNDASRRASGSAAGSVRAAAIRSCRRGETHDFTQGTAA
jgi:hypothetical protein